jgi:hypothetical protein
MFTPYNSMVDYIIKIFHAMGFGSHTHNPIIISNPEEIQNTGLTKLINKHLLSK